MRSPTVGAVSTQEVQQPVKDRDWESEDHKVRDWVLRDLISNAKLLAVCIRECHFAPGCWCGT